MTATIDIDLYGEDDQSDEWVASAPLDPQNPSWMESAARRIRRIRKYETERALLEQAYANEINLLERRRDEQLAKLDAKVEWLADPLRQFHAAVLRLDPERKTIVVPGGSLRSRTPRKPKVFITNESEFVEWAQTNAPDLVKTVYKADRPKIAVDRFAHPTLEPGVAVPVVAESGELVPGVEMVLPVATADVVTEADEQVGDL